jgi:hypothetical protein
MKFSKSLFLSALLIVALVCLSLPSNGFDCGDVNNDGAINIFDATFIIRYLYLNGAQPPEMHLADVNNSGEVNIFDITDLISFMYLDGDELECPPPLDPPSGSLVNIIDCFERGDVRVPPEEDCIEYNYDGTSTLLIRHINAGFNCCPLEIYSNISIAGDEIMIQEYETFDTAGPCACLCLFEVYYQIDNLPPGQYTIEIQGQYVDPADDFLNFTVDLRDTPIGEFSLYRGYYPWVDWSDASKK